MPVDGRRPAHTLAVGDYKYDVMAGRDAGCRTVLVEREGLAQHELVEWGSPDLVVKSLRELLAAVRALTPPKSGPPSPREARRGFRGQRGPPQ